MQIAGRDRRATGPRTNTLWRLGEKRAGLGLLKAPTSEPSDVPKRPESKSAGHKARRTKTLKARVDLQVGASVAVDFETNGHFKNYGLRPHNILPNRLNYRGNSQLIRPPQYPFS